MIESGLSFEREMQATAERHFVEKLDIISSHSQGVVFDIGEYEGDPYTNVFFVLNDQVPTPEYLSGIKVEIGLQSEVSGFITTDGNNIIVNTPLSPGVLDRIFKKNPPADSRLQSQFEVARAASIEKARQINLDSIRIIRQVINSSLGRTYAGDESG